MSYDRAVWWLLVAVATAVVLVVAYDRAESCPPDEGMWTDAAGDTACAPCPPETAFDAVDAVPLPLGCAALRVGVWRPVRSYTAAAGILADVRLRLERATDRLDATERDLDLERHAARSALAGAARDMRSCAETVNALGRARVRSPWPDRLAGAAVGIIVGGVAVFALSRLP